MIFQRKHFLLFAVLLIALFLFGCSNTSDDDSDTDATDTKSTAITQPDETVSTDDTANTDTDTSSTQTVIVLADISDNPSKTIDRFQPLADYLAQKLADYGIEAGEVLIISDMESMAEQMEAGNVDLYFDSLYPALVVSDLSGATPILRRWKDGEGEYNTLFFVRADSDYESLDDLQGQVVAFDEATSTSGYLLPYTYLFENDYNPLAVEDASQSVDDDEIGYVYSGDDENTIQWVASGKTAAGAVDNLTYIEIPEDNRESFRIIAESEFVARQVVLIRPGIDPELQALIIDILINMDEDPDAVEVLDTFKTTQFDEFPEGAENAFNRMRELFELIQDN